MVAARYFRQNACLRASVAARRLPRFLNNGRHPQPRQRSLPAFRFPEDRWQTHRCFGGYRCDRRHSACVPPDGTPGCSRVQRVQSQSRSSPGTPRLQSPAARRNRRLRSPPRGGAPAGASAARSVRGAALSQGSVRRDPGVRARILARRARPGRPAEAATIRHGRAYASMTSILFANASILDGQAPERREGIHRAGCGASPSKIAGG